MAIKDRRARGQRDTGQRDNASRKRRAGSQSGGTADLPVNITGIRAPC